MSTALLQKSLVYLACSVFALGANTNVIPQAAAQQPTAQVSSVKTPDSSATAELPDSPGTAWILAQNTPQQQTGSSQSTASPAAPSATSQGASQTTSPDQTQKPQRPVGTAAAEAPKVNAVTAAQPAGVAVAPAKQRRVRTIVLRVGAIVGASVAIGSVIALTEATPSKPPGAH